MAKLRILQKAWDPAWAHLNSGPGEHFVFFLARHYPTPEGYVLVADEALLVGSGDVTFADPEWVVSAAALTSAINRALGSGRCLIEAHNHGAERPRFSFWDRAGLAEVVPYIHESIPGCPYGALVTGASEIYGELFDAHGGLAFDLISAVGQQLRILSADAGVPKSETADFDRQLRWLTTTGQRDLARLRFVVGGTGGTGAHAALGLAYLGARRFVLMDPDCADRTSLHRLSTARAGDAGKSKVALAAAAIQAVAPSAEVHILQSRVEDPAALAEAKMADVLVGCFDNDGARAIWNELAVGYQIPLLDFGVGIHVDADGAVREAGGRIAWVLPEGPCLRCMRQIDRREVRDVLRSKTDRIMHQALGYVTGHRAPEASVYALNAAVVNLGLTELTLWLSGVRAPEPFIEYDALGFTRPRAGQWLTPVSYTRNPRCIVCATAGVGDKLRLEARYGHLHDVA